MALENLADLATEISMRLKDPGYRQPDIAPLPSREMLRELLHVAFFSTLLEEEGRATTFTLGYVSAAAAAQLHHGVSRFSAPVPLAPDKLAKLAPAADRKRTCLGIQLNSTSDTLEIWGLIEIGDRALTIDMHMRPTFLVIDASAPGVLSVTFAEKDVLRYTRGQTHFPGPDELTLPAIMRGPTMSGAVGREFARVARRVLAHGHGGSILIVDVQPVEGVHMHPHYTFDPPSVALKEAFEADQAFRTNATGRVGDERWMQFARRLTRAEQCHREALQYAAQLSAVDGGTLMLADLTILGFGVTIETKVVPAVAELDAREPRATPPKPSTLDRFPGNRHRSAIRFCAAQKGLGVALVASQDGGLTLFGRALNPDRVLAIRHLEAWHE